MKLFVYGMKSPSLAKASVLDWLDDLMGDELQDVASWDVGRSFFAPTGGDEDDDEDDNGVRTTMFCKCTSSAACALMHVNAHKCMF